MEMSEDIIVSKIANIEVRVHDLLTVQGKKWLNGEVVEAYLRLCASESHGTKVANTFLWVYLQNKGIDFTIDKCRKLLRGFQDADLILIPVHNSNHWSLVALDRRMRTLIMYDSLRTGSMFILQQVRGLLSKISLMDQDYVTEMAIQIPIQKNSYDCGMFVCMYGRSLIFQTGFPFTQSDMPALRQLVIYELIKSRLCCQPVAENRSEARQESTIICEAKEEMLTVVEKDNSTTDIKMEETEDIMEFTLKESERFHDEFMGSMCYKPELAHLELLRKGSEPFVDMTSEGKEFTRNVNGDWRRYLNLNEVLDMMDSDQTQAWKTLENNLKGDPSVGLGWLGNATPKLQMKTPFQFRFGSRKNFLRPKTMVEALYPNLKIVDAHEGVVHGGGRKSKSRKQRQRNRGRP